jgi:hypothetical protein
VGLRWFINAYSSHSIHNAKEVGLQSTKGSISGCKGFGYRDARGSIPGMQGDGYASKPGGNMEVAVWLCLPLLLGFDVVWV